MKSVQESREQNRSQAIKEWGLITLGIAIMTIGIYFFKFPNHFSTGGVTGIAVVLGHYFPRMTPATFVSLINVFLLIVGFLVFGRTFGMRTVYASLLMSGLLQVLEVVIPLEKPMTSQPLLELMFAVGLPAVGSALLFNLDASSGGTDIVAMILKKFTSLNIGIALICSDIVITVAACFAFGMETGLFSILGLIIKSLFIDVVTDNLRIQKCFHIITSHPEPVEEFITQTLHRGATRLHGEGVYTHDGKEVLLTVVSRHQAVQLRNFIHQSDPSAFLIITTSTEIIGKGFRGVN
ncbi:MAG: YitT family protein [Clostridia bacterium]|nr:YitT family protein [Clostridia bacterium]